MYSFFEERGWHYCEEIFALYPVVLAEMITFMFEGRKKMKGEAISICKRNPEIINHLKNPEQFYNLIENQKKIILNPLHTNIFGPSNPHKYFSFSEFGIREEDIIFVDSEYPHTEEVLKEIVSQEEIGVDT